MDLFEKTRSEFLANARWTARILLEHQPTVTSDDIRRHIQLPEGISCKCWGAVFSTEEFEKIGYTQTKIKTSHGRPIAIWRLRGGER